MRNTSVKLIIFFCLLYLVTTTCSADTSVKSGSESNYLEVANSILNNILNLYSVQKYGLLSETYPINKEHKVDYLAEGSMQKQEQEVSFLWPYSGVLSGVVVLYRETKSEKYKDLLEAQILPGLEKYFDESREPAAYQSYPIFAGHSDRFYDDNVWLALDFCVLYESTNSDKYLKKALQLYDFIYSGWDEKVGGGIYWCEQKKTSKNTCSNAPSVVLGAKLYRITGDEKYLNESIKTYEWTKNNLMDPTDGVYWDNVNLEGKIDKRKYTYNSGQMIEAGVLLYQITKEEKYLLDAQKTAAGTYRFFVKEVETKQGIKPFYPSSPWFNTILFRGLKALYEIDGNPTYVDMMKQNALYAWQNTLDNNRLFSNTWHKESDNKYKWLLDNACMIELFTEFSDIKENTKIKNRQ